MHQRYYKRGLAKFEQYAEGTDWYEEFLVLADALRANIDDILSEDENTRRQRQSTIMKLNALSLRQINISFNGLCEGKEPPLQSTEMAKGQGIVPSPSAPSNIKRRWAVLVGVIKYKDKAYYKRLPMCTNDVHALHQQLIAGGFKPDHVSLLVDKGTESPTRGDILYALDTASRMTDPDDLLLFYYSGHGDLDDDGKSYLVAHDGRRLSLSNTAVLIADIKKILMQSPAQKKIMLLDACHSGIAIPGKGPRPMSAAFIRRVYEEAQGLAILASCMQDQKSWPRVEKDYSVFTYYLLQALRGDADYDRKGFITIEDIHRYVTDKVKMEAFHNNRLQTPNLEAQMVGDIICVDFREHPTDNIPT